MASKESKNLSNEKVHEVVDASDSEANYAHSGPQGEALKRTMKNRHIAMIRCVRPSPLRGRCSRRSSIGGVIGTGLFLGTATALHNGGPVGLLLGYAAIGSICFAV